MQSCIVVGRSILSTGRGLFNPPLRESVTLTKSDGYLGEYNGDTLIVNLAKSIYIISSIIIDGDNRRLRRVMLQRNRKQNYSLRGMTITSADNKLRFKSGKENA